MQIWKDVTRKRTWQICGTVSLAGTLFVYSILYNRGGEGFLGPQIVNQNHAPRPCETPVPTTEVTVLTAFFDIGVFPKGSLNNERKPDDYFKWMEVFEYMDNPLIAFTNNKTFFDKFKKLRKSQANRSQIFLIDPSKLWTFSISKEIKTIFSQPGYPKHLPNTVYENYTCMTHAKYELLEIAVNEQTFPTKYIAWVDLGLYRDFNIQSIFHITLPARFNENKVSLQEVFPFRNLTVPDIIKGNINWVGGGMLIGRLDKVMTFTEDYIRAVKELMKHKLMNVEQHVIYSLYSQSFYFTPRVEIQTFNGSGWYGLALACRAMGFYNGTKAETNTRNCHNSFENILR